MLTQRKMALRWTSAAVAVAFGGYLAFMAWTDRTLEHGFRNVTEGTHRDQVVASLGPPDTVRGACRDLPTWMNRPVLEATCAEELEFHAGLKGVFWTVGFDAQGKAIAKYRYVSR